MPAYRDPGAARSIVVDFDSAVPLYRQIADGLRALIARGSLAAGDELPSVRALGGRLGVNLNTVAKAYRLLAEEAVVALDQGRPARVLAPPTVGRGVDEPSRRALMALVGRLRVQRVSRADVREVFEEALDRFYPENEEEEEK